MLTLVLQINLVRLAKSVQLKASRLWRHWYQSNSKEFKNFSKKSWIFFAHKCSVKIHFKKCYLMYSRKLLILEISTKTIISWRQLNIQICFQFTISSTKVSNAIFGVAICTLAMLTLAALMLTLVCQSLVMS